MLLCILQQSSSYGLLSDPHLWVLCHLSGSQTLGGTLCKAGSTRSGHTLMAQRHYGMSLHMKVGTKCGALA